MKNEKRWYNVAQGAGKTGEIQIFNDIGFWGITAMQFAEDLKALGDVDELSISISSDGGDVSQGFAIFNILNRHPANKVVRIEGLAASMASVIAMVGDTVIMPGNSMMMIHNPWGGIVGEADQVASFGDALATMQDNIADAYVARTGKDKTEILDMMARETWLSAKKSVELGFADRVEADMKIAASFNLEKFQHAPKNFRAKLLKGHKMSKAKNAVVESESEDTAGAKTEQEIRNELKAYAREVRSLCNLAGKPDLAEGFIDKDASISEVIVALETDKGKGGNKGGKGGKGAARDEELDAHNRGTVDAHQDKAIDTTDIYARWNQSGKYSRR